MVGLDQRFYPVIIQDWRDPPTEADLQEYFGKIEAVTLRAMAERMQMVQIAFGGIDLPAVQRRQIADFMNTLPAGWDKTTLDVFVIVTSAVARGALTALKWISPQMRNITFVASIDDAIERARRSLEKAGIPVPAGLNALKKTA